MRSPQRLIDESDRGLGMRSPQIIDDCDRGLEMRSLQKLIDKRSRVGECDRPRLLMTAIAGRKCDPQYRMGLVCFTRSLHKLIDKRSRFGNAIASSCKKLRSLYFYSPYNPGTLYSNRYCSPSCNRSKPAKLKQPSDFGF